MSPLSRRTGGLQFPNQGDFYSPGIYEIIFFLDNLRRDKVIRKAKRRLLDFGLDGVLFSVPKPTNRQGQRPGYGQHAELRTQARPDNFHGQLEKTAKIEIAGFVEDGKSKGCGQVDTIFSARRWRRKRLLLVFARRATSIPLP